MSLLQRFKTLDVYREMPKDLTNQTVTGAAGALRGERLGIALAAAAHHSHRYHFHTLPSSRIVGR